MQSKEDRRRGALKLREANVGVHQAAIVRAALKGDKEAEKSAKLSLDRALTDIANLKAKLN